MQDALQRRIRFAPPQPEGKSIVLSDSDIAVFEALHRHGPLPSNYLKQFSSHTNSNAFSDRLTKLYNGAGAGGYLTRPPQYFNSYYAKYQHIVYDLSEKGTALLSDRGYLSPFINRKDHLLHRLMGACVGASIELLCREKGLTYIPRSDVLYKKGNQMELPVPGGRLEPDDLFGIQYSDGSKRRFVVEIDRSTEPRKVRQNGKSSLTKKYEAYEHVIQNQVYREQWGVPGITVLWITTRPDRAENIKADLVDYPGLAKRSATKVYPTFGSPWRVPQTILTDILDPLVMADGRTLDITVP